jgi:hypothetical protein
MDRTRRLWRACWQAFLGLAVAGCAAGPPVIPVCAQNPLLVPNPDSHAVFEVVVDVVDDYFTIDREEPIRQIGTVLTEGRIETFPVGGSTVLEPWRGDSANGYERLESTLQSIQRRAIVRLVPDAGGHLVEVVVLKELEDVPKPAFATAASATLRQDGSLERYTDPVAGEEPTIGWIPIGRDLALEQRILACIQTRLTGSPEPFVAGGGLAAF